MANRRPKINWEPIKAMFIAGKTSRELSIIFGIRDDAIRQRSKKDGWGALRKQVRDAPLSVARPEGRNIAKEKAKVDKGIGFASQSTLSEKPRESDDAISRALRLRTSDSFREDVINQANRALKTLEKATINNVFETDRFAEALTKVERIGARAYGYDREGDHPIINIGILGSGSEYDPI